MSETHLRVNCCLKCNAMNPSIDKTDIPSHCSSCGEPLVFTMQPDMPSYNSLRQQATQTKREYQTAIAIERTGSRTCQTCGVKYVRKSKKTKGKTFRTLEAPSQFHRRKFCSQLCAKRRNTIKEPAK